MLFTKRYALQVINSKGVTAYISATGRVSYTEKPFTFATEDEALKHANEYCLLMDYTLLVVTVLVK